MRLNSIFVRRLGAVFLPLRSRKPTKLSGKDLIMIGKIKSLREFFEVELGYAYDCEKKLAEKGLPSMIENANSPELRTALQQHLQETQSHVTRLERVFGAIGADPKTQSNEILDKMTGAAKDSVSHFEASPLRDVALVLNGNQVEHYEIALYGSLVALARSLGLQNAVGPLEETLKEEKAAGAKLTQLGEALLNTKAAKYQTA
jgi:ferritin-like metal-binding protein YciE